MDDNNEHLDTLRDIKKMMERSSRFISLSGFSGVAAGCCALIGAAFAYNVIHGGAGLSVRSLDFALQRTPSFVSVREFMGNKLLQIAFFTFAAAVITATFFTYLSSKKKGIPMWGPTSKRLMINVSIPMIVGGIYLLKLIESGVYGLIAPGCLIFYGLALVNASKYTLVEIRYLGYGQILLGLINLWMVGCGLYFWALGFGVLHIVYGIIMWLKYERK